MGWFWYVVYVYAVIGALMTLLYVKTRSRSCAETVFVSFIIIPLWLPLMIWGIYMRSR